MLKFWLFGKPGGQPGVISVYVPNRIKKGVMELIHKHCKLRGTDIRQLDNIQVVK